MILVTYSVSEVKSYVKLFQVATLNKIVHARAKVLNEIQEMRDCLTSAKDLLGVFQDKVEAAGSSLAVAVDWPSPGADFRAAFMMDY